MGYPLAFMTVKLCHDISFNEIKNLVTKVTSARFEPSRLSRQQNLVLGPQRVQPRVAATQQQREEPRRGEEKCIAAAVILFDIQGFFDNIIVERIVRISHSLGFPPSLCAWLHSFLTERSVKTMFQRIHIGSGSD